MFSCHRSTQPLIALPSAEFRVIQVADIKTDITGLTPAFNWIAEDLANIIINSYKDVMIDVVETVVKDLMQQVLDQIVIP